MLENDKWRARAQFVIEKQLFPDDLLNLWAVRSCHSGDLVPRRGLEPPRPYRHQRV